jgi:hypothetical protein
MDVNKYLEAGYRMRLWVTRGNPQKAAELFLSLSDDDRRFRSFKKIDEAARSRPAEFAAYLNRLFSVTEKFVRRGKPYIRRNDGR